MHLFVYIGFPGSSAGKEYTCQYRRHEFNPGSGRSLREGNGNPLQYSTWEILWTEEPGGLQSMGSQELDTT